MDFENDERRFTVYRHVSPNGKQYVGITSKDVLDRWGNGGSGYKDNSHLWYAICKYGWDSFQHEIIASNLSLADACEMECNLIQKFDLMNPDNGYNHTSGGQYSKPSQEVREKLKESTLRNWKNPEFRKIIITKLTGHTVSDTTRQKLRETNSKIWREKVNNSNWTSPLKGRKLSEEQKRKLRGRVPITKGKTKYNDAIVAKISAKLTGRVRTQEHRNNISISRSNQYKNGYSPVWVNNGSSETTVDISCKEIPKGYCLGRLDKKYKYIHKDSVSKKIPLEYLETWLSDGWELGRGSVSGISKAAQKFTWIVDGISFATSEEVANYLRENGYPEIVSSTVTSLYNKGFNSSKKYSSLEGRIQRSSRNAN